ncbi:hypothetical protein ACO0LL_08390 [Undibacterium sp. TC4M20W]|uniref:hypothetical protein n=1 Tax=unclassified Undibacterium TaxID=2630295 RepID=UPI003BEFCC2D
MSIPNYSKYLAGVFVILLLQACSIPIKKIEAPAPIEAITKTGYTSKQKETDITAYQKAIGEKDASAAKTIRNRIVLSIRREIEVNYSAFERSMFENRAQTEVGADILELALSTAATLTGAERARKNLTALLTGVKGSRLSIDKNFFADKTYGTLVAQMRTSRANISADIYKKLALLSVEEYSLEQAEIDLVSLFNAGTLHEAVIAVANKAGQDAVSAEKNEKDSANLVLDATVDDFNQIYTLRKKLREMYLNGDIAGAKKILKALDSNMPANISNDDVWKNLDAELKKTQSNKAYLKTLLDAFNTTK